ncbi:Asparagine synthetase [glutamine-hydrolyzing] (EC [Olavius sp. associated proteobacterium Delta 1]|nr:Asparagine synthetase [glutamine-hydrolyzing] (EC [Olavius sp. associated proteobacterium Delta 1]
MPECYWFLSFAAKESKTEVEFIEKIETILLSAVKRRMVSDVPLGAFLSGGIDSSLVVAMMATVSDFPVKTFSIGYKDEHFDELKYARMVAEKYSTDHHEFIVAPDAIGILPEIVWSYGEPFSDSSQIPTYYVAKMTRQKVTVALSGDGGDEAFGGYGLARAHYMGYYYRKYLPSYLGNTLLPSVADALVTMAGKRGRGLISKIKTLTEYGKGEFCDTFYLLMDVFGFELRDSLYTAEFKHQLSGHTPIDPLKKCISDADGTNEVDKWLYIDIKNYLPNDILTKVDVATMMNSLEARSPFLDYQLLEYAARIPSKLKLKFGIQKYLLKKLAEKLIPHDIIYRPKQGFSIPLRSWIMDNFKLLIEAILFSDRALKRGYFKVDFVRRLAEEHSSGKHDHSQRIWALL